MINKISRVAFINSIKAGPSVFCGLVYTMPNEEVSADCINAIRVAAKEIAPRNVRSVSPVAVTFDDDSNLLIGVSGAVRNFYQHDDDLLEAVSTEHGSDITKHMFYLLT